MFSVRPLIPALLVLLALPTIALSQPKQIRTEADYRAMIVGKTLVYENGTRIKVAADGTLSGTTGSGEKIVGAWNWQRRFFCRNVIIGQNELGSDCQVIEIDGNKSRTIRNKGRGDAGEWVTLE